MKKIVTGLLAASLLAGLTYASAAGGAGSASDPLVSKSYAESEYLEDVLSQGSNAIEDQLQDVFDQAAQNAGGQVDIPEGYIIAKNYDSLSVPEGETVTLASGSSIIVISGTMTIKSLKGTVIDISTAQEMEQGAVLTRNTRYFCAEDTSAVFAASANSVAAVNGYYLPGDGVTGNESPYGDVNPSDWFYAAVLYTYEQGIMTGMGDGLFSPKSNLTRGMIAQVLYNMEGEPQYQESAGFSDVSENDWYFEAVSWAAQNALVEGYGDGLFGPQDDVTREQMALLLYRYAQYKGYDTSAVGSLEPFPDGDSVSSWAAEAMAWAVGSGLMLGDENNALNPSGTATRAEVAQLLTRFHQNTAQ